MENLITIQNTIEDICNSLYLKPLVLRGDIYENLNAKTVESYPVLNVDLDNVDVQTDSVSQYNFYLYFADRLTEGYENIDNVQANAIAYLHVLIRELKKCGYQIDYTNLIIYPFRQQFADLCGGAYVNLGITVVNGLNYCNTSIE